MRRLNRILGLAIVAVGFALAGWAPRAFEVLSGHTLPTPVATDVTAMTIWSGVAFVRAFGAVLVGFGGMLWAATARTSGTRSIETLVFVSSAFAAAIVLAQQVAIWANAVGYVLVGLFGAIALVSGIGLLRNVAPNAPADA